MPRTSNKGATVRFSVKKTGSRIAERWPGNSHDRPRAQALVDVFVEAVPDLFCERFRRLPAQGDEGVEGLPDSSSIGDVVGAEKWTLLVIGKGVDRKSDSTGEIAIHRHAGRLTEQVGKSRQPSGHVLREEQPAARHGDAGARPAEFLTRLPKCAKRSRQLFFGVIGGFESSA